MNQQPIPSKRAQLQRSNSQDRPPKKIYIGELTPEHKHDLHNMLESMYREQQSQEAKKRPLEVRQKISEGMKRHNAALREGLLTQAYLKTHTEIDVKSRKLVMVFERAVRLIVELVLAIQKNEKGVGELDADLAKDLIDDNIDIEKPRK